MILKVEQQVVGGHLAAGEKVFRHPVVLVFHDVVIGVLAVGELILRDRHGRLHERQIMGGGDGLAGQVSACGVDAFQEVGRFLQAPASPFSAISIVQGWVTLFSACVAVRE